MNSNCHSDCTVFSRIYSILWIWNIMLRANKTSFCFYFCYTKTVLLASNMNPVCSILSPNVFTTNPCIVCSTPQIMSELCGNNLSIKHVVVVAQQALWTVRSELNSIWISNLNSQLFDSQWLWGCCCSSDWALWLSGYIESIRIILCSHSLRPAYAPRMAGPWRILWLWRQEIHSLAIISICMDWMQVG